MMAESEESGVLNTWKSGNDFLHLNFRTEWVNPILHFLHFGETVSRVRNNPENNLSSTSKPDITISFLMQWLREE